MGNAPHACLTPTIRSFTFSRKSDALDAIAYRHYHVLALRERMPAAVLIGPGCGFGGVRLTLVRRDGILMPTLLMISRWTSHSAACYTSGVACETEVEYGRLIRRTAESRGATRIGRRSGCAAAQG